MKVILFVLTSMIFSYSLAYDYSIEIISPDRSVKKYEITDKKNFLKFSSKIWSCEVSPIKDVGNGSESRVIYCSAGSVGVLTAIACTKDKPAEESATVIEEYNQGFIITIKSSCSNKLVF